ncbi:hypothetical protein HY623_03660 [Candidatus Uhrbacteria bacterium]|nr:hypothetical protein [Candidatus Uhrbacteria bacterium]
MMMNVIIVALLVLGGAIVLAGLALVALVLQVASSSGGLRIIFPPGVHGAFLQGGRRPKPWTGA